VQYSDKKYSHIKDSVNIHSWGPSFDFSNNDVGFSLYSQNIMNTLYSEIGYKRNLNENTNSGHLSISYSGLYPVITTDVIYGGRTSTYTEKKEKKYYSWNELSSGLSFTLPFTLSTGYFQRYVNLTTGGRYMKITDIEKVEKNKINNGTFLPYLFGFTFFNGYQWYRDINPVWGQYLTVNYFGTPDKSNFNGKLFSAISMLFFPGILKHHSFYLSGSYEYQNPDDYVFSSLIRFPRGYSFKFMEKLSKGTANYTLPLFYPDYNFIQFLHFKQIFFNAFFDYGYGITGSNNEIYRSFGGEIVNEMFFFDLNFPINVGLRASYILDGKDKNLMIYEIVLGSNINY